ncbi:hypothetical protein Esti_001137 [Eimeria stiedai]
MYCCLQGTLPCGSTRSVAWWEDWLLLGTDEGIFRAIRIPSSLSGALQTGDGNNCFAQLDRDDFLHTESHKAHLGQVRCVCTAGVRGLVAIGDTEGGWSIWKEADGKWVQGASSLGCSSPVIGLNWVFPSAQSPHVSLCSLHEDGRLQSGTTEGFRLWSRTLRKHCVRFCAAANGEGFVVATEDGELLVYDSRGVYGRKLPLKAETSRYETVVDLDWQPGSWGIRPLLVAFSTGHAFFLHTDEALPALPIDSRLTSCVAAKWNPSGSLAALLGVPVRGSRASVVFKEGPAASLNYAQKGLGLHQPGVGLRLVQASGEVAASVNFSSEDAQTLAWASNGRQIAAVTNKKVSVLLVRQKEVFASSDKGNFVVGTLIPEPLVTQVCFWREKCGSRSIRAFRGPRILACCDDLCAVAPYATAALPPNFLWDSETYSFEQSRQSHQQHQGPYLLPEEEGPKKPPLYESNQHRRHSCDGFPVELCDAAGHTLEILMSPLGPRHAVLLPHCLVISDGSHQLWICWLKPDTQVPKESLAFVIDLTTLSAVPPGSGEVTALGGRGCCLVVASSVTQPTLCTSTPVPLHHVSWKIYGSAQDPHAWQEETLTDASMFLRRPHRPPKQASIQEVGLLHCLKHKGDHLWVDWAAATTEPSQGKHNSETGSKDQFQVMMHCAKCALGSGPSLSKELCEPVEHALDYQWASDHGDLIAVLQLTRVLLVYIRLDSGSESSCMEPEEPSETFSEQLHLIDFSSLCARALCTKSISTLTAKPSASEQPQIIKYNAEPLLQMRRLVNLRQRPTEGGAEGQEILYQDAGPEEPGILQQAAELAARLSHPTLWKLLADTALAIEKLEVTEEAFVKCEDYIGLQVLKRVRSLKTGGEGVPLMVALAGDILGAGAFYEAQHKHIDAASLFLSFGYWKEAADTLNVASASQRMRNSAGLSRACESLAEAYGEMGEWQLAIHLYKRLPPQKGLLDALFYSEKYEELESVAGELAEGEEMPLLLHAAQLLAAAGRGQAAAASFLKAGKPHDAIDAAWRGGEWQTAIRLAREHCGALKVQEIACAYRGALQHRQDATSGVQVVEAFMKLGIPEAAAHKLNFLTDHLESSIRNPLQQPKKKRNTGARKARIALCAAVRLRDCYSMEIPIHTTGRLLCISACMAKEWRLCSQALHALKTNPGSSVSERKQIEAMGVFLCANRQVAEPAKLQRQLECPICNELSSFWECFCPSCDVAFPWCAATGVPIRYLLLMRGQSKTSEAVKATIQAICGDGFEYAAKEDNRTALSCEENWPYGGPESPLACRVCGLSTAAWGPEGPIEDCPLCTQPFLGSTEGLVTSQETQLLWREDRVARYLSTLHPEEILSRIEKLNEPMQLIS